MSGLDRMSTIGRPKSVMPGGGVARRPLHVILLADCSGSMTAHGKIQALNFAIADMVQHFASWEREQEKLILVRAIAFATEPWWHIANPEPAAQLRWRPLTAVTGGRTNMAPAFRMAAKALSEDRGGRSLPPVIVLVTDGQATDSDEDFDAGLAALLAVPAGRDALRIAVAIEIGGIARSPKLTKFIGNSSLPILVAGDVQQIADQLHRASIWVTSPNLRSAGPGHASDPGPTPGADDISDIVM